MHEDMTVNNDSVSIKKERVNIFNLLLALSLIGIGFFFGYSLNDKSEEIKDYTVYLNDESQTFRNTIGRKVYPISIDGQVYLPVSGLGSYLDYMTVVKENGLYLYTTKEIINSKLVEGFETETLDGDIVDSSLFKEADYTVFMVWATWCKYCNEEIESFKSIENFLVENNIQMISVPTDLPLLQIKDTLEVKTVNSINEKSKDFNFKYHLFRDDVLNAKLIGNTVSIPKLVIFDKEGSLIKIIDDDITGEELKKILTNIIK